MKLNQYVLEELDKWYGSRVKKSITQLDIDQIKDIPLRELGKIESLKPEQREQIRKELSDKVTLSSMIGEAQQLFTKYYALIEAVKEGYKIKEMPLHETPPGVREEYYGPYITACGKLEEFVNSVREKSDEKFPENLTDKDIDYCFIRTFENPSGFAECGKKINNASLLLYDLALIRGVLSKEQFQYMERNIRAMNPFFDIVANKIFGDLG